LVLQEEERTSALPGLRQLSRKTSDQSPSVAELPLGIGRKATYDIGRRRRGGQVVTSAIII
jgi:hypothetical protein